MRTDSDLARGGAGCRNSHKAELVGYDAVSPKAALRVKPKQSSWREARAAIRSPERESSDSVTTQGDSIADRFGYFETISTGCG